MLITTHYVEKQRKDGTREIFNLEEIICPECGEELTGYDRRRRTVIDNSGERTVYLLRRLRCPRCKRIHIEAPCCILPEKHYSSETIMDAVSSGGGCCPADDSTIRRWKRDTE